jgi:glyoxylase-like metal-dependent hydrolase (beta-lactamase superfamily II)
MGAIVNLDRDGAFFLASDAVSLRHNLDTDTAPRNTWNAEALLKSFAEIRHIERSSATVVCGHDDPQWQTLKKGQDAYE